MQFPKESFNFLKQLKRNNNREWFANHKATFNECKEANKQFFNTLGEEFQQIDQLEDIKIFRIYRDVRFSKDKTPYKTTFSANYKRLGAERRGSYYVHIEPDNSFIAVGFYGPEKNDLLRIRKELMYDASELREIIQTNHKQWGDLQGDELKTAPRGFDKNHPDIDLIRKKNFYFQKKFTNKEVLSPTFIQTIICSYKQTLPFLKHMSEVLTTDENGMSLL